jgi:hypothetical protein
MTTGMPGHSPALPDEDLTDPQNEIRLLLPGTLLLVAFLIACPMADSRGTSNPRASPQTNHRIAITSSVISLAGSVVFRGGARKSAALEDSPGPVIHSARSSAPL